MKKIGIMPICCLMLWGCALSPHQQPKVEKPHTVAQERIERNSSLLADRQKTLRNRVQTKPPLDIDMVPVMPTYDSLEEHTVSFSMVDEGPERRNLRFRANHFDGLERRPGIDSFTPGQ